MPVQNTDRNTTWLLNVPNQTWTLTKNATITTVNEDGIYEGSNPSKIIVKGDIKVTGIGEAGIRFDGSASSVEIGKDSVVNANAAFYGIWAEGAGSDIVNRGVVRGGEAGIYGSIWADVKNFGTLGGHIAVLFVGDASQIYNYGKMAGSGYGISTGASETYILNDKGARISGSMGGILLDGPGETEILNKGLITSADDAIRLLDSASLHLVNKGKIQGDIVLADSTNFIDTRKGDIKGVIEGGSDDDTILIGSKITFTDTSDTDFDQVRSLVGYRLSAHVEALTLLGKANINGTGNAGANELTGNSGNNRLTGLNGNDHLDGRQGNDRLTGNLGADTFHFNKGYDVDRITDFQDGMDRIDSAMVKTQQQFDNLNIRQTPDGVVINFGHGDRLIIDDVLKTDIDFNDFVV